MVVFYSGLQMVWDEEQNEYLARESHLFGEKSPSSLFGRIRRLKETKPSGTWACAFTFVDNCRGTPNCICRFSDSS